MAANDIDWMDLGEVYRQGLRHVGPRWLLALSALLLLGLVLSFVVYFGP